MNIRDHIKKEALGSAASNGIINGAFAWYLSKDKGEIFVWGPSGLVADFFYTTLILAFLLSLIVLPLQRKKITKSKEILAAGAIVQSGFITWLATRKLVLQALLIALIYALVSLPLLWVIFASAGSASYSPMAFTGFKALYTAVLSAAMIPLLIKLALLHHHISFQNNGIKNESISA